MWPGEFTDAYFAQPAADPAMFGMSTEDDGKRDDTLLSERAVTVTPTSTTSRPSRRRRPAS